LYEKRGLDVRQAKTWVVFRQRKTGGSVTNKKRTKTKRDRNKERARRRIPQGCRKQRAVESTRTQEIGGEETQLWSFDWSRKLKRVTLERRPGGRREGETYKVKRRDMIQATVSEIKGNKRWQSKATRA